MRLSYLQCTPPYQDSSVEALHCKVIKMENALATERTLRQEAEMRLSALKDAKSDVNELLEGILKANEAIISISSPPLSPPTRRETNVPQVSKLVSIARSFNLTAVLYQLITIPFLMNYHFEGQTWTF